MRGEHTRAHSLNDSGPSGMASFVAETSALHSDVLSGPKIGMIMFIVGAVLIVAALLKLYVGESMVKIITSYRLWAVFSIVLRMQSVVDWR